jgi:hypothetical protein
MGGSIGILIKDSFKRPLLKGWRISAEIICFIPGATLQRLKIVVLSNRESCPKLKKRKRERQRSIHVTGQRIPSKKVASDAT